jgi:uncharacterized membrane protein YgcG
MKCAYNKDGLHHLDVIKETKLWLKSGLILQEQFDAITKAYTTSLYHPNFIIRLLLFVATLLGLSGVTGVLSLMILPLMDNAGEDLVFIASALYGIGSFIVLEKTFIQKSNHYKSGVNEALLYHAAGFTILGIAGLADFNTTLLLSTCLVVFTFSAIRYLDLLTTATAVLTLAGFVFYECYQAGGIMQQIIPFVFLTLFIPVYFLTRKIRAIDSYLIWNNNLLVVETLSLLLIYLSGNYLVVRELSINLMGLSVEPGQDIPFAWIFYLLTVIIPVVYLFYGIKNKDIVLLRVSLIVAATTAFTFNHYFGFEKYEMALTVAGAALIIISIALLRYLKIMHSGYTSENMAARSWADPNLGALLISQTMSGNQIPDGPVKAGGGEFGGGGASGDF